MKVANSLQEVDEDNCKSSSGDDRRAGHTHSSSSTLLLSCLSGNLASQIGNLALDSASRSDIQVVLRLCIPGEGVAVVEGRLQVAPGVDNLAENTVSSRAVTLGEGNGPLGGELGVGPIRHWTRVGIVDVEVSGINFVILITGRVGQELEDIGTTIPTTQRGQEPIGRNAGNGGVVGVKGVIRGAYKTLGDRITKENAEDSVGLVVGLVLVVGQEDQSALHEVFVVQKRLQPSTLPSGAEPNSGVVRVIGHVRSDKGPLRKLLRLEIMGEVGEVLDVAREAVI